MAIAPDPITRVFLVGCPRSGTTLLQSLLATHPDAVSFPETFFFTRVVPGAHGRRERLHLASAQASSALRDLDALGIAADPAPGLLPSVTVGGCARRFTRRMDRSARAARATTWIEKTPSHARHIGRIQAEIEDARFIHMIRSGTAVAASLRDANTTNPETWQSSAPRDLIALWRLYLSFSTPWIGHPNHTFVSYERLVSDTEPIMRALCDFASLRTDGAIMDDLLTGYRASSAHLIGMLHHPADPATLSSEPWKQDVARDIVNRNHEKFARVFTETERQQIASEVQQEHDALRAIPFL